MESKNRFLKALIIGAVVGIASEFIIKPYVAKPVEKKVEEIL